MNRNPMSSIPTHAAILRPALWAALWAFQWLTLGGAVQLAAQGGSPLEVVAPQGVAMAGSAEKPVDRSHELLEEIGSLPVLDAGRVKPLSTVARYGMMFLARSTSYEASFPGADGSFQKDRVSALHWYAAMLLNPSEVRDARVIRIDDTTVLDRFRIDLTGFKRRDLLSWRDLERSYDEVLANARTVSAALERTKDEPTVEQRGVQRLARQLIAWQEIYYGMGFARFRASLPQGDSPEANALRGLFPAGTRTVHFGHILRVLPDLLQLSRAEATEDTGPAAQLVADLENALAGGEVMRLFPIDQDPPADDASVSAKQSFREWQTASGLAQAASRRQLSDRTVQAVSQLCAAIAPDRSDAQRLADLRAYRTTLDAVVARRGQSELRSVGAERAYHNAALVKWSWGLSWFGVVTALLALLFGQRKWPYRIAWGSGITIALLLLAVMGWRSYIVARPPVGTLYETIPFITFCMVVMGLVVERLNRRRLALAGALLLGALGSHLAVEFESLEAQDTLKVLPAVLLSDYWLIVHVLTINLGYAASLFAALLGSAYVVQRLRGARLRDPVGTKELARMVYGAVCFGLVAVSVGTILGGVWANDSWGRFWGWDPKENGAALIAIAQIMILHARLGGHVKDLGVAVMAALTGIVVLFSWFHVNLLGVGLHSYGHSDAVKLSVIWGYYILQGGVAASAWLVPAMEARAAARLASPGAAAAAPAGA